MKRLTPRVFCLLFALAALASLHASAARGEAVGWSSVRTRNFTVVGEAREKDLRRVATRLEEYRAALARLLPEGPTDASAPTTVIVFRDDNTYRPFKPVLRGRSADYVAGYFQPGSEVNYITLALDSDWSRGPASTLLHEYTHLLVNNYFRSAPLWLKEGLAEFYSTARVSATGGASRRARNYPAAYGSFAPRRDSSRFARSLKSTSSRLTTTSRASAASSTRSLGRSRTSSSTAKAARAALVSRAS